MTGVIDSSLMLMETGQRADIFAHSINTDVSNYARDAASIERL